MSASTSVLTLNQPITGTPTNTQFGTVHTMNANSCFDPFGAFGSGQPRGFDQLMAVYNRFEVKGAKFSCGIQNSVPAPTSDPLMILMHWRNEDEAVLAMTSTTLMRDLRERPNTTWKVVQHDARNSRNYGIIKSYKGIKRIMPLRSIVDRTGTAAANPSALTFCDIYVIKADGSAFDGTESYILQIYCKQYALFFSRTGLAAS